MASYDDMKIIYAGNGSRSIARCLCGFVAAAVCLWLPGCASITGDSMQSLRVETRAEDGTEVPEAECELKNEYGTVTLHTPGSASIRRSSTDLFVFCKHQDHPDARAQAVSRANSGMYGNIVFGGAIGAVIDHNNGKAYTYPQWLRLIMGQILTFDRSAEVDGQPVAGINVGRVERSASGGSSGVAKGKSAQAAISVSLDDLRSLLDAPR